MHASAVSVLYSGDSRQSRISQSDQDLDAIEVEQLVTSPLLVAVMCNDEV